MAVISRSDFVAKLSFPYSAGNKPETEKFEIGVPFSKGRRADLLNLLWWDGDGLYLFAKHLERGRFVCPETDIGTVALTRAQLSMVLEGINWPQGPTVLRFSKAGRIERVLDSNDKTRITDAMPIRGTDFAFETNLCSDPGGYGSLVYFRLLSHNS